MHVCQFAHIKCMSFFCVHVRVCVFMEREKEKERERERERERLAEGRAE